MNEILWSEDASNDLIEIISYSKNKYGTKIAQEASDRIILKIEKLISFPNQGKVVPELNEIGLREVKEILELPWRIFYKYENSIIYIISIIDGRRNIEEILYKKIIDGRL
jgi:toxin ParE1/3/4